MICHFDNQKVYDLLEMVVKDGMKTYIMFLAEFPLGITKYASVMMAIKKGDRFICSLIINTGHRILVKIGSSDKLEEFFELAIKLSVLGDLKQPTSLTFTVPDQWSITREETWEFTREINNDLRGQAYGTAIKYESCMAVYKWIYVLFKMYSELL